MCKSQISEVGVEKLSITFPNLISVRKFSDGLLATFVPVVLTFVGFLSPIELYYRTRACKYVNDRNAYDFSGSGSGCPS